MDITDLLKTVNFVILQNDWYCENNLYVSPTGMDEKEGFCLYGKLISPWWHIYASVNQVSIGSDNGLSPTQHQAIIWTNARLLSIKLLGRNFSEILIKIQDFSFTKLYLKILSAKWRPFCLTDIRKFAGSCPNILGRIPILQSFFETQTWFQMRYDMSYVRLVSHYSEVIMSEMASQITGVSIVYSTVCSGTDQRKPQSSTSLAFVRGIHGWPANSLHKGPVMRKMFSFDDIIMCFAPFVIVIISAI